MNRKWLPRFGMKTLLVLPLIVAVYFALGEPTKKWGMPDVRDFIASDKHIGPSVEYRAPLVIAFPVIHAESHTKTPNKISLITKSTYYFWCFGFVAKLPFETERTRDMVKDTPVASVPGIAVDAQTVRLPRAN